jgi:hypothetical protein
MVTAESAAEMRLRRVAGDVEPVGVGERGWVVVGIQDREGDERALWNVDAAQRRLGDGVGSAPDAPSIQTFV